MRCLNIKGSGTLVFRLSICFSSTVNGGWSEEGCSLKKSDDNKIICVCNHLTNFAVLMQVGENEVCSEQVNKYEKLGLYINTFASCKEVRIPEFYAIFAQTI